MIVSEDLSLNGRLVVSGNVGIGTVTTYSQFEIKQTQNVPISLTGSDLTKSAIRIQGTLDRNDGLYIGLMSASGDGNNQTAFIQNTWDSNFNTSFLNAAMVLNPSGGYVGIGTTNPKTTLDVNGSFSFGGYKVVVGSFMTNQGGGGTSTFTVPNLSTVNFFIPNIVKTNAAYSYYFVTRGISNNVITYAVSQHNPGAYPFLTGDDCWTNYIAFGN
jgi:hypothetical protein